MTKKIALIGNPNSGKTTLFNNLTGAHQKVGNWSGVTVEKKTGSFSLEDVQAEVIDLPGIYSLEQEYQGLDEEIARNFLANEKMVTVKKLSPQGSFRDFASPIWEEAKKDNLTPQDVDKIIHLFKILDMLKSPLVSWF